ncbi:hypothetical protein CWC38_01730 [Kocuria tytonicola]|uniref:LysM peptidoglycan-binding domain-containing protein n=1 Tax=Kocuria tytonicola TaxID=2055946 RepID=A0A3L9L344_9MICC|nr:LysM peptidoglycan-binding domain-containing protein [Kocuria tytonicola]RLY92399.1 LysM peptidoglycan-binding domain-containing protein [Kocuria tytonicola]RLZ04213.1 hypothetical protein CWC38_01730 [Kocuria tytonicola]
MTALIMPRSVRRVTLSTERADRTARTDRAVGAARRGGLHLTRRGRFFLVGLPVVTGAAALLVVAAVFLFPSTVKASTGAVGAPVTQTVTVQPRQTLWDIAREADPERDTREVVNDIAELNGLTSPALTSGQVLEVPAR